MSATKPGLPLKAKDRLVVRGDTEDPTGIRSDAPTSSLLAFHVLCSVAASRRWKVYGADAANAEVALIVVLLADITLRALCCAAPKPSSQACARAWRWG